MENSDPSAVGQSFNLSGFGSPGDPSGDLGGESDGSMPDLGSGLGGLGGLGGENPDLSGEGQPIVGESPDDTAGTEGEGDMSGGGLDLLGLDGEDAAVGTTPAILIENTVGFYDHRTCLVLIRNSFRYTLAKISGYRVPEESS